MKKIIFYIDSMQFGGAQRVMNNLLNYYVSQEVDVILINDIVPVNGVPEYAINSNVKRLFLDDRELGRIEKNMNRMTKLRKIVKEENPDVILSFLGPPNIRMLMATIGLSSKKIVSVRNDPYREYGFGIKRIISKVIFELADGCVFQTKDAMEYFGNRLKKKAKIILNPVDERFYKTEWNAQKKHIISIGRLEPQKNPGLLIRAFASVSSKFPDYELHMYGEGNLKKPLAELCTELGIQNKVFLKGHTNEVDVKLSEAMVFALTSDYEGMPNVLMEAMTVGIPVIATDCPCGGPRMLINNDREGVLVTCGDEKMISDALERILSSQEIRTRMSENERERAKVFRPGIIYKEWNDFVMQIIQ